MKNMFIDFTDNFSTTAAVYNILRESIDNEVANSEIITEEQPLYLEFIAFGEAITDNEASYYFTPMMDELWNGKGKPISSVMIDDISRREVFHIGEDVYALILINMKQPHHDVAILYDKEYVIQICEYLNVIAIRKINEEDKQFLARQKFYRLISC